LGINRVECERGLSGARQTREHDELIARELEIHVLEVMGPRATDDDGGRGHERFLGRCRRWVGERRGPNTIRSGGSGGKTPDRKRAVHSYLSNWSNAVIWPCSPGSTGLQSAFL